MFNACKCQFYRVCRSDMPPVFCWKIIERKSLNEFARLYRKQAGELGEKEFCCETTYGKIYLSEGDRLEFRKNDKSLKVTNGLQGTLIKASVDSFTVQVKEGNRSRKITFNPKEFRNFQLGYATTYYRSQGRTVDQAYVLHSPMMNKEMFYVGLTRHVRHAQIFVSEEDSKNIADLKRQAFKSGAKSSILDYLNSYEFNLQKDRDIRFQDLEALKSSGSVISKLKGYTLSSLDGVRSTTQKLSLRFKDRRADEHFFNPKTEEKQDVGRVEEVKMASSIEEPPPIPQHLLDDFKKILSSKLAVIPPDKTSPKKDWSSLPDKHRELLKNYYKSADTASSLYTVVKAEEENRGVKSAHFNEWQKACGARNSLAYEVLHTLSKKDQSKMLGSKSLEILQNRAIKHENHLEKSQKRDYDGQLKERYESLLHKLFPEGPTRKDQKGLRFGTNGSLSATLTGTNAGTYYNFEEQQGGGPLHLIQKSLGLNHREALSWAKDFLGEPVSTVPSQFTMKKAGKEQEWVSLKSDPKTAAPSLKEISKGLDFHYKETARYTYRDEQGSILYHTLRLEDKAGKKIVIPLSYGYLKGNEQEPAWSLKGYQSARRPLFNLHLLTKHPQVKVLLVEGEKAAEAASKLFPNDQFICMTWSGGAGAVNKSDWTSLQGRGVIIWPDNDKAGFEASSTICSELRKTGVKSFHEVDKRLITQTFPPKWDLADPLPQGKDEKFIHELLLRAQEKSVGLDKLRSHLQGLDGPVDMKLANELLWRIEERMRPELEEKHNHKTWEIHAEILGEVAKIVGSKMSVYEELKKQGTQGSQLETLTHTSLLYQSQYGNKPHSKDLEHHAICFEGKAFDEHSQVSEVDKENLVFQKSERTLSHIDQIDI